jgi:hypothetical protein
MIPSGLRSGDNIGIRDNLDGWLKGTKLASDLKAALEVIVRDLKKIPQPYTRVLIVSSKSMGASDRMRFPRSSTGLRALQV